MLIQYLRKSPALKAFLSVSIFLAFTACNVGPNSSTSPKHVVLITMCTARWDAMGFNGGEPSLTPNLDALAKDGVVFTNCVSHAPWTKPSVASILTGLTPNVHGVDDFYSGKRISKEDFEPNRVLSEKAYTLAEYFTDQGYATLGRTGNVHAHSIFNLDQGFDSYAWPRGRNLGPLLSQESMKLLDDYKDEKLFLFHLAVDAHHYSPPFEVYKQIVERRLQGKFISSVELRANYERRGELQQKGLKNRDQLTDEECQILRDLYDGSVAVLDFALGMLFQHMSELGIYEDAAIIVSADHGEELNEHDFFGHRFKLYDTLIRTPLVVKAPRLEPAVVDAQVRNVDIYPTLVELTGGDVGDYPLMGRSVLPLARGAKEQQARAAVSSDVTTGNAMRFDGYKLINAEDGVELYNLRSDPRELNDIADQNPAIVERLKARLGKWIKKESKLAETYRATDEVMLDQEIRDELESLGYID